MQEIVGDVDVVHVEGRKGDLAPAEISGARAASELGWRPETPLRRGRPALRRLASHGHERLPARLTASRIAGSAPAVARQEPLTL